MAVKAARGRHPRAVTQQDRPQYRGRRPGLVSGGDELGGDVMQVKRGRWDPQNARWAS